MISVHYYDPWDFCGTESADKTQWGSEATNQSKVPTWGDESYMASQFKKMNDKFVSQGYGVIIGEFGAINKQTMIVGIRHVEPIIIRKYVIMQNSTNWCLLHGIMDSMVTMAFV